MLITIALLFCAALWILLVVIVRATDRSGERPVVAAALVVIATVLCLLAFLLTTFIGADLLGLRGWDDWNWDTPVLLLALGLLWLWLLQHQRPVLKAFLYLGAGFALFSAVAYGFLIVS